VDTRLNLGYNTDEMSLSPRQEPKFAVLLVLVAFLAAWSMGVCRAHADTSHTDCKVCHCGGGCTCVVDMHLETIQETSPVVSGTHFTEEPWTGLDHCSTIFHPPQAR